MYQIKCIQKYTMAQVVKIRLYSTSTNKMGIYSTI